MGSELGFPYGSFRDSIVPAGASVCIFAKRASLKSKGLWLLPGLQGTNPWQLWRHDLGVELAVDGKLELRVSIGMVGTRAV